MSNVNHMRRTVIAILALVALYLMACAALFVFERHLIYLAVFHLSNGVKMCKLTQSKSMPYTNNTLLARILRGRKAMLIWL
jgi:hypothetical protein